MTNTQERFALSRILKGAVKTKGVSQKSIALEAFVHESTVSRWLDEENPTLPDPVELAAICRMLGISPAELLAPFGVKGGGEPNLLRLWSGVLGLTPDQRGRLADLLESISEKSNVLLP